MKRIIIDHRKLTPQLASFLLEKYPEGYGDNDIIQFKNSRNEWIEAVELQTNEALYLIKISKNLADLLATIDDIDGDNEYQKSTIPEEIQEAFDGTQESEISWDD